MGSKRVRARDLAIAFFFCCTLLLVLGSSDLTKDREECGDKLVGLASCLEYVRGEGKAKAPSIECCSGLKEVLDKSKKCICILIKDRDDPNLGFNMNATLAVHLPNACHAPANISQCVDLLHLAPNSPEAKVFEGFEKSTTTNTTSTSTSNPVATGGGGKGSSASAQEKSSGGWGKGWVCGILPFVFFISHFVLV